ncbi:unnamed protein product [Agarophyton chilense]
MRPSATFVVVCGVQHGGCKASQARNTEPARLSRRSLCRIGAASIAHVAVNTHEARAQLPDDASSNLDRFMKQSFAREMEYSMNGYEALITEKKKELFGMIDEGSTVVDVGMGTGPNIRYMPKNVNLIGIEPNEFMWPYSQEKARESRVNLTLQQGMCENMALDDESCDFVITTLTLCSVQSPSTAMEEILRVLKRGGKHLFVEHVVAPPNRWLLRAAQTVLNPLQVALADGCHLNRDTITYVKEANYDGGFERVEYEEFDASFGGLEDWVSVVKPHIIGFGVKRGE